MVPSRASTLSPRSQLAIIPQGALFVQRDRSENLDPRGLYEDGAPKRALEQCHLSGDPSLWVSVLSAWWPVKQRGAGGGLEPPG